MYTQQSKDACSVPERQAAGKRQQNEIWQEVIRELADVSSNMTKEEEEAYLNRIMAKLKSGKKLSSEEMEYLRINHPELYKKAMRVKHSRERLEHQLKNCRSKEQVNDVVGRAMGGISSKDPDREYLAAAYQDAVKSFKQSSGYGRLPNTDEDWREKRKKGKKGSGEGESAENEDVMPIQELIDRLPVFDTMS